MKTRTLSIAFFVGILLLTGCKKSSDTVTPGGCDSIVALSDKFSLAVNAYTADPSNKAKCNAYIDAYKAYADAVIACNTVYTQKQRDDIQASYTQAKDACK